MLITKNSTINGTPVIMTANYPGIWYSFISSARVTETDCDTQFPQANQKDFSMKRYRKDGRTIYSFYNKAAFSGKKYIAITAGNLINTARYAAKVLTQLSRHSNANYDEILLTMLYSISNAVGYRNNMSGMLFYNSVVGTRKVKEMKSKIDYKTELIPQYLEALQ